MMDFRRRPLPSWRRTCLHQREFAFPFFGKAIFLRELFKAMRNPKPGAEAAHQGFGGVIAGLLVIGGTGKLLELTHDAAPVVEELFHGNGMAATDDGF
jgi:hypothetical protein